MRRGTELVRWGEEIGDAERIGKQEGGRKEGRQ
jgi:hypothetical protein